MNGIGRRSQTLALAGLLLTLTVATAAADAGPRGSAGEPASESQPSSCHARQYIFSWSLSESCRREPRGGTTAGAPVTLVDQPSPQWHALQEPGLSKFERDRRAILAMSGGYRASFEFLETIGYPTDYDLAAPYQSWGTEYVYVVEDRGDFISLQHVMVMVIRNEDGSLSEPMVMKHWRQDWHYQDTDILEYSGDNRWETRQFDKESVAGTWSQSVYQVDDSPRYAAIGSWQHNASFSAWQSGTTWRPLPRREHSVRDDYEVLEGINRHVILPTGWVQEEENLKRRLTDGVPYIAKELGNNRYQRITGFDWSEGDAYWRETGPFWAVVRRQWAALFDGHPTFALRNRHDGAPLFVPLFQLAEEYRSGALAAPEAAVAAVLRDYLLTPTDSSHQPPAP